MFCQAWSSETPEQEEEEKEKEEESAQVQIVRDCSGILGFGSIKAMSISRSLNAKKRSLQALEDTHEDTFTRTLSQATSRATSQYHGLEESGRICFSFQQFQFLSISRKGIPS